MKTVLLAGAATLALGCSNGERGRPASDSSRSDPAQSTATAGGQVQLKLPSGFTATVFAENLGSTRHLAAGPGGTIYANTWHSPYDTTRRVPAGGYLVALRDTNGDGRADVIRRFGSARESGSKGGTGIALNGGELYAEADSTIVRYRVSESDPVPAGKPEVIVSGLVTKGGHPMHPIAVDAKSLYVNIGSATNSCQVKDREGQSPGHDPCRELDQRAGIWRFSHQPGQRWSPAQRYATGIRNAGALAFYPDDGTLYATQHGRDQLGDWTKLYNPKEGANLPAEELLHIRQGGDYGWPYCYYDPTLKRLVLAPEYGGDKKTEGRCASKLGPVAAFPAHWAPNGLVFYNGSMFPQEYRGGAFIAFHGSWNRAPEPQEGYNVVFQPMSQGNASGEYRVFADGFAGSAKDPGNAAHRPAGLAVGADGALYISDDQRGTIWRVAYK
ncbi:MAG TPA: PQQ-dependent sugar dehydrogenase [Gemmatimonadales bacterium]